MFFFIKRRFILANFRSSWNLSLSVSLSLSLSLSLWTGIRPYLILKMCVASRICGVQVYHAIGEVREIRASKYRILPLVLMATPSRWVVFLYLHISQFFITERSVCLCNSSWLAQLINVTALFFAFKAPWFENTYKLCIVSAYIYFWVLIIYPFTSKKTI